MTGAVFRTPDERFVGLPDWPWVPRYAEVAGLRLARVDEGDAAAEPVVLLHGEPTWSFLYRRVIPPLLHAGLRVVAPDFAGFGRSDKPTDVGWYTYDRHVALLTAVLDDADVRRATLVVQDWGGPVGLRWAMEQPDRVARVVILNTGLYRGRAPKSGFAAWLAYVREHPDLPVGAIVAGSVGGLPDDVIAGYEAPFPTRESKAGALAFPFLVPTEADSPGAREIVEVETALRAWPGPVQVAFSDRDPIFPSRSGAAWTHRLRGADPFVVIEGAGHFLQEQQPDAVARVILDFVARHPLPA